ncbi:MAG: hypothetical protein ACPGUD_00065 [Parashewanella sp.]
MVTSVKSSILACKPADSLTAKKERRGSYELYLSHHAYQLIDDEDEQDQESSKQNLFDFHQLYDELFAEEKQTPQTLGGFKVCCVSNEKFKRIFALHR